MSAHAGDERLGPYCLRERLGEGGMGVVYLASDGAERLVAIKVLRQGVAADETARRRLAHEVETMRRVHSPYVAEVIDADLTGHHALHRDQVRAGPHARGRRRGPGTADRPAPWPAWPPA